MGLNPATILSPRCTLVVLVCWMGKHAPCGLTPLTVDINTLNFNHQLSCGQRSSDGIERKDNAPVTCMIHVTSLQCTYRYDTAVQYDIISYSHIVFQVLYKAPYPSLSLSAGGRYKNWLWVPLLGTSYAAVQ